MRQFGFGLGRAGKPLYDTEQFRSSLLTFFISSIHKGNDVRRGHKEYALPKGRKDDPNFDMVKFRADIAMLMKPVVDPGTKTA